MRTHGSITSAIHGGANWHRTTSQVPGRCQCAHRECNAGSKNDSIPSRRHVRASRERYTRVFVGVRPWLAPRRELKQAAYHRTIAQYFPAISPSGRATVQESNNGVHAQCLSSEVCDALLALTRRLDEHLGRDAPRLAGVRTLRTRTTTELWYFLFTAWVGSGTERTQVRTPWQPRPGSRAIRLAIDVRAASFTSTVQPDLSKSTTRKNAFGDGRRMRMCRSTTIGCHDGTSRYDALRAV